MKLGVNIDHVATVRQARREAFPDPLDLALDAIKGGADGITAHLREDRRHIQDEDITRLKKSISVPLNMEMAVSPEIIAIAKKVKPAWVCLVPEKREELTTEGGLNLAGNRKVIQEAILSLKDVGIQVSAFVEPEMETVQLAKEMQADAVELHTGAYAKAYQAKGISKEVPPALAHEIKRIVTAAGAAEKNWPHRECRSRAGL